MFRLLLCLHLPLVFHTLTRIEQDDEKTPYQVLVYFATEKFYEVFDVDYNLYAPGIVRALEKIDKKFDFTEILGSDLTYKMAHCDELRVDRAMDYLESQLITRKYQLKDPDLARSELSLILGPIMTVVFVKPFCYGERYNCVFGIGRISTASQNAISEDLDGIYYGNLQTTNNLILDNTVDGPEPMLEPLFELFRWNFKQISIFTETKIDSFEQAQSFILDLQAVHSIDHSSSEVFISPEDDHPGNPLNYTLANDYLLNKVPLTCRVDPRLKLQDSVSETDSPRALPGNLSKGLSESESNRE
ncbi:hypothetical protein ACHWQZ_G006180 [Mnemiopsis leidyi]